MNELLDDVQIEKEISAHFSADLDIDSVIVRRVPVGRTAEATLFLTKKKQLFLYVDSQSQQLFSDVKKIVSRMGLKAGTYYPPKGRAHYFDQVGTVKFQEIFPGRKTVSPEDIAFYRTLAPYRPALVLINEVTNGMVYQYDSDSASEWRPSVKFTYRRISTS